MKTIKQESVVVRKVIFDTEHQCQLTHPVIVDREEYNLHPCRNYLGYKVIETLNKRIIKMRRKKHLSTKPELVLHKEGQDPIYRCGNCKRYIENEFDYCPKCGTEILWENDNENN